MDDDVPMMDAEAIWEDNDVPSGADFVVPLNFSTSRSPRPSIFSKSPTGSEVSLRKGTPIRARPGSPWIRGNTEDSNVETTEATWAPLQDAPSDSEESDQEVDLPQDNVAAVEGPSTVVDAPQQVEDDPSLPSSHVPSSPESPEGFAGGKTLSQRFAELSDKLATEGRSFRRSLADIDAMPSSDAAGAFDQPNLKFPDLPSSSPEKHVEEEPEESIEESAVSASVELDEQVDQSASLRQEEPAESGLNEYSSQDDREDTGPMEQSYEEAEQPDYATEDYQESTLQESTGLSVEFQEYFVPVAESSVEQTEVVAASFELNEAVDVAVMESKAEALLEPLLQHEVISVSPIADQSNNQDASFISPIRGDNSPQMDITVHSEESDSDSEEDEMDESGQVAESTYDHDVHVQQSLTEDVQQQPQMASIIMDEPKATPGSWRRISAEGITEPMTAEDQIVECGEEIEDDMEHGPSWEDETDAEPLVQIRSNDPMAAARAAAILNLVSSKFASQHQ